MNEFTTSFFLLLGRRGGEGKGGFRPGITVDVRDGREVPALVGYETAYYFGREEALVILCLFRAYLLPCVLKLDLFSLFYFVSCSS